MPNPASRHIFTEGASLLLLYTILLYRYLISLAIDIRQILLTSLKNFLSPYTVDHCSEDDADTELSSGGVRGAQAGVRSFGIDDILGHTSVTSVARRGAGLGRSPLDALFTMTTNFDSLKQKSGAKMQIPSDRQARKCLGSMAKSSVNPFLRTFLHVPD